jgi:tetratricopeptide (TPR) repeat protein
VGSIPTDASSFFLFLITCPISSDPHQLISTSPPKSAMLCPLTWKGEDEGTLADREPDRSLEDTQPRPIRAPQDAMGESRGGCGNPLLVGLVAVTLLVMAVATIALAAIAGWRDGGIARQTQRAVALVATLDRQATLGWQDIANQQYELAFSRCDYVVTLQPFYPEMHACMSTAQAALNATPTPTATPTPIPPTPTPSLTPPSGGFSPEELFARGQEAVRRTDYESAMGWLEALRALDASYRRQDVEDMLVQIYLALGQQYRFEGRLSEMVNVIEKALKIRPLTGTDWGFTVDAAKLYMSARGYLDAGNAALAAQVFARLMATAPTFSSDTKALACQAFAAAGDVANAQKYGC